MIRDPKDLIGKEFASRFDEATEDLTEEHVETERTGYDDNNVSNKNNRQNKKLGNKKRKSDKNESRLNKVTTYKYSNKGRDNLYESIILNGRPYFVTYDSLINRIDLRDHIQNSIGIFIPPNQVECPFSPYEFKTVEEPNQYLLRALKETPDSLLEKIKSIVRELNDADDKTLNLLSLTIFNSYFQDRFSTVYYLVIVGANGTGKSVFGDTFECLGYRPVKVTNTTDAFWFRIFGINEFGQVTIIAEEFDKLDESSQTMAVLKEGYQSNGKVPRMNNDNSKMEFFCPFGFKITIAEKSPNENKARGVLDRSFKIKSYKGYPEYKIKEIRNPQGNPERQKFFNKIVDLRNLLLAYRLLHFKDPYKEVDIGLDGRDEELCKPSLELLYTLGASQETLRMTELTLQHFLDVKNKRKGETLEALIYPIVVNTVFHSGVYCIQNSKYVKSIPAGEIWRAITNALDGNSDEKKSSLFYSDDFGKIYRNTITGMICDKFGAEIDHRMKGNNLIFNPDHLIKTRKIYHNLGIIKTRSKDDSMTHKTHAEPNTHIMNHNNDNDDSFNAPHLQSGISESSNHHTNEIINPPKVKCPTCEYMTEPFYMKIHQCPNRIDSAGSK